ncbi:hypothetical protein ABIE45_001238 [Methylobacterium sp. OAE515]
MPFRSLSMPVAALGLSLAACSGEPSESEMLQAVTKFTSTLYQQQTAAMAFVVGTGRGGMPAMPTITAFRKIGCQPVEIGAGHVCEFTATLSGKGETRDRARFVRAAEGALVMSVN